MSTDRPRPVAPDEDRIALLDQGSFLALRALGHQPCFHATWTYERAVDLDAVHRFNSNLRGTLLGRLVERSPVPGGRHRWVPISTVPEVEIEDVSRPRSQILDWTDEFGDRGTDPERGPGWRVGVLPLTDGGTAVTMIVPHTLGDGLCVLEAISDAVDGHARRPAYPQRGDRRRGRVLWSDAVELLRSLPAVVRAVAAAVRVSRAAPTLSPASTPLLDLVARPPSPHGPHHVPMACVRVDQTAWDAAAAARGGTSNTLVSAFAARLSDRLGRTDVDGIVTLAVPVSVRTDHDTRANALASATIRVDPRGVVDDLTDLRAATKAALSTVAAQSRDLMAVLPLIPLMPASVARRAESLALGAAASPVGCSNYGDLPPAVLRIDGRDPDDFWVRLNEPGRPPADIDRIGGQLYVLSGRALGSVFLSTVAEPAGGGLEVEELHREVAATLAEFDLS